MARVVVDDHILRDVLVGRRERDLGGLAPDGLATTGNWLFRLCSAWAEEPARGRLTRPVAALSESLKSVFVAQLVALPHDIEVVPMGELAWPMAELRARHRPGGTGLSAAMAEALAAALRFGGAIAVSVEDVGPNLRAAAQAEGVPFHPI